MTQTNRFIVRLERLKNADRFRLREFAGKASRQSAEAFDLFTGLWWPLRERSQTAPRRETSMLVAALFASFNIPHVRPEEKRTRRKLAQVVGLCEPTEQFARARYSRRFDTLLQTPLSQLKPHLMWALTIGQKAVERKLCPGIDWAGLLDDLSAWDRGSAYRGHRDIRVEWAEEYLSAAQQNDRR